MGLDCKVSNFFKNYLVGWKTQYCWNNFTSPSSFNINVGIGQGSVLSPILSALYLSPIFHSLEKRLKNLKIPISLIYFVDNELFVSQNKSILHSNANLFCSYNIMSSLLLKFGLIIEHGKTDIFYFSRAHRAFNPPSLDLSPINGSMLLPKDTWRYLVFIFDCKFIFRNYRFLLQQSNFYHQMYEVAWQFHQRHQPYTKAITLQMLCITHCALWILFVVLQQSTCVLPPQYSQENATKSFSLDHRSFLNVSHSQSQDHCGTFSHTPLP